MEPPSTRPPDLDGPTIDIVVADPGWHRLIPNAGTIIRAADSAGADGVILTGRSVDLYNPKVVRATTG